MSVLPIIACITMTKQQSVPADCFR